MQWSKKSVLTDFLTYRLTYPLARYFKLAWVGNICNELLWRKLKPIGIFFYLFLHPVEYWFSCLVGRLFLCQTSPKITALPSLVGRTTVTTVSESGNITYGHSARRGCLPCSIRVSSLFQVQIFPCRSSKLFYKMTSEVISEVGEGKCLSLIYCL